MLAAGTVTYEGSVPVDIPAGEMVPEDCETEIARPSTPKLIRSEVPGPPMYPALTPVGVIEDAATAVGRVPACSWLSARFPLMFAAFPGMSPTILAADTLEIEASLTAMFIGRFPGIKFAIGITVTFVPRT
jgi:hypothetical protein